MYTDHRFLFWPVEESLSSSLYSSNIDDLIEKIAVHDLVSKRLNRQHLLASDIYCHSNRYKPIQRSYSLSNRCQNYSYNRQSILPRPISPVELPKISFAHHHYQPPIYCKNCHRYDFSTFNSYNREPSFFPLAHNYYRLQTDYENFSIKKKFSLKKRWKSYGFILIFYFLLKKTLRLAKQQDTYYQRDYDRIRFLELLTAIHRVYLEPNSSIHKSLSLIINSSTKILNQNNIISCVRTILNQITNFLPNYGILGCQSNDSVLIYLLNCSLEQYPTTYFWSIERHLLSISYSKMKQNSLIQLDHFTTKFLIISTFIFRGLIKTLLLKPVKYRLTRGKLNHIQWSNTRLLSTIILSIARHAVIYKQEKSRLPMPFPFEMNNYLIDDEKLKNIFPNLDQLIELIAPKISSWACEYAERLQRYIQTMKK